ncbi:hypothetical protein L598_001400000870 [Mesorhizobium sp. J18]|uniref:hypothetical protein n=1 Tax=Mesorhizobium sp. J18 TaxID=935263 RepID=UPI00119AEAFA|nr:hypothetical protein [Mesorhizobium sp. J18]TWG99549.1 hypothetical protein L598_001400000870 [Mesorhizobium sp. J18]
MRIDDFAANMRVQSEMKTKAKEQVLQAQIENALAERPVGKVQPNPLADNAVKASEGAQGDAE